MKKRSITAVLAMVIIFAAFYGSFVCSTASAASKTGVVNTDGLNIRSGAGTGFAPVQHAGEGIKLNRGAKVRINNEYAGGWYGVSFVYGGRSYDGYAASMYITPDKKKGVLADNLDIPALMLSKQKIYFKAAKKAPYLKSGGKVVKLKAGKKVTISRVKKASKTIWYEVVFTQGKNRLGGYITADKVKINKKNLPAYISKKTTLRSKASAGASYVKVKKKAVKLKAKASVTVVKEKTVKGKKWFNIKCKVKKKQVKGWVPYEYVMFRSGEETSVGGNNGQSNVLPTVLSDAEFEAEMTNQGFPESYKPALRQLHASYPYWQFKAYNTGLDWNSAVAAESEPGKSVIPDSKDEAWKSFEPGAYDWATDTHKIFDGTSWVAASRDAVAYYMDPRNFLNEKNIFMFESLSYEPSYQNSAGVDAIFTGTYFNGASYVYVDDTGAQTTKSYRDTFIDAAVLSGVSPFHLASRVRQEVVTGATSVSNSVTGTVPGYEGIYNFFNIGASDSAGGGAVEKGLAYASVGDTYMRPWNNQYKSICGGALYISGNYIKRGQNTLYLERFNVTPVGTYTHQYMTNVSAACSESLRTYEAYKSWMASQAIVFYIPVYNGMPAEACKEPSGNLNPNNCLKTLSIRGNVTLAEYALTPAFTAGDTVTNTYTVSVPASEGAVTITAQAVNAAASVTGGGVITLTETPANAVITVTAQNGDKRNYMIIINRY